MRVCTVQQMRDSDRKAVESLGLSTEILMENAGHAVWTVIRKEFGMRDRRFFIVCGGGNNGGDGLVVARLLHSAGADASVFLLAEESACSGAALANLRAAVNCGVPVTVVRSPEELYLGRRSDVVVDAMFGTGLSRKPDGLPAALIGRINAAGLPVLSVDIPSGVNGDTGAAPGVAVRATCTVTLGLPKRGNLLPPGRELCGRLYVSHISFPPGLYAAAGDVVTGELAPLPVRRMDVHKGECGDVLFLAGARQYMGAPYLAAMSFLRAGGGYARLATPVSLAPLLAANASEAVLMPLHETSDGAAALSNLDVLLEQASRSEMLVVGPGVSLHPETQQLVRELVGRVAAPVLVDGDGLTAVASAPECVSERRAPTVLTPHAGEMARLLQTGAEDVQHDRVGAVDEAAKRYGATVLLKGASTLVASPGEATYLNLTGNPGMATAGCGDVLTGTIAAIVGAGLAAPMAVAVGAFVHGLAGDMAAEEIGQDGMVARDVLNHLPRAVRAYRNRFQELMDNHCGRLSVI